MTPLWTLIGSLGCGHPAHPAVAPSQSKDAEPPMEARSDRRTDGSWDERVGGRTISTHTLVVFDEGWGWPPGSYRVRVDGLFDFGSERPVKVVCEGQIHEPGHEAGTYAIDIEYSEVSSHWGFWAGPASPCDGG